MSFPRSARHAGGDRVRPPHGNTRLVAGDALADAGRYAAAAAALSTEGWGAVAPIPRASAVRAALEARR